LIAAFSFAVASSLRHLQRTRERPVPTEAPMQAMSGSL
jgi:hypothetical protein